MKHLFSIIILLLLICNSLLKAETKNYLFRHYQVENGLSDNMVSGCVQDKDGYIWIGTRDGLNRFDGYTYKVFRNDPDKSNTLGSNMITSLGCDRDGKLWVGTLAGIYQYDDSNETFHHLEFTSQKNITHFEFDKNNHLWALMEGNLIEYNPKDKQFHIYSGQREKYTAFCVTKNNEIWGGDAKGNISLVRGENNESIQYNLFKNSNDSNPKKIFLLCASQDSDNIYVAYEHDDVKIFNTATHEYRDLNLQKIHQFTFLINSFMEKTKDELWIGTDSGLITYNLETGECSHIKQDPLNPYALSSPYISSFNKDRENGIWICFHQHGIDYYSPFQPFNIHYPWDIKQSMKGEVIRDICTDTYGNIWTATEDAGINCLEKQTGTFMNYQPVPGQKSLSHTNIRGLASSGDKLWIGHVIHGIDVMDIKSRKIINNYSLLKDSTSTKNSAVRCIKVLQEGQIYVGTDDGIFKYDFLNDKFRFVSQFPSFSVNCIYEDRLGRIWTGMYNRSFYFSPVSNTGMYLPYDKLNTQRHNFVNDICEDKEGNMWFATFEGVIKYDFQTGESQHYTDKNGMPSNVAFKILPDESGKLWISTPNGLVCLDPATNNINCYTEAYGLITRQFNDNSGFKDQNGVFYFGSVKGFIHFSPKDVKASEDSVNIQLGTLDIEDKNHEKKILNCSANSQVKRITLTHTQSTFSINFSALSFIAPNSIRYAYRMGNMEEWIPIGERNTVYFTELHPGDYTFEVRATNLSNHSNAIPTRLNITILPPWWQSTTALLIYIIGGILILFTILYIWRRKTQQTMQYNMQLFEDQKEKELYQAKIDFFINIAHEIRTPLTLIKNPLERILHYTDIPEKINSSLLVMDKNVERLLNLVNQLLDFRKTEIAGYKLNFVKTDVISILSDTMKRFEDTASEKGITMRLESSISVFPIFADKEALTKILSNLFTNAIKYATYKIEIRVDTLTATEELIIDVLNDGNIISEGVRERLFEPFFRLESDGNKPGSGLGLPLARSLAEMHQGSLKIVDSTDDSMPTCFRLSLPVKLPESIKTPTEEETAIKKPSIVEYTYVEGRPTILIVEDNNEMSKFLAEEMNQLYNVQLAYNGAEALEIIKKQTIQLVISDIMMPVMDGFALLKEIKTDLEFSHIPVVMLTARNTPQSHIEGLEMGADAYFEKPFSTSLLMVQVGSLLSNRDKIRKFYFNSPIANMKSMAYTKADESFLEKLNEIIISNISNPDLDVNMIADLMHLSRPTLYRKIKAISEVSPNELIKITRLKKAAELLLQGDMKIFEIAEAVGFSSQSYFWSAFVKQFGVNPSKYAKEKNVN